MSGYQQMRRALSNHVLSRPRGVWQRLLYPVLRTAYTQGYESGYAIGFITADEKARAEIVREASEPPSRTCNNCLGTGNDIMARTCPDCDGRGIRW